MWSVPAGCDTISGVSEPAPRTTWDFPEGSVGHSDSVKGYTVEAKDGPVGEVSWADYKPGESYLVLTYRDGDEETHHVVPAGAVAAVDHEHRTCTLKVTAAEVKATPPHEDPEAELDWAKVQAFDRGMLGGGYVWPYTDV
jgi:hypothetical protein